MRSIKRMIQPHKFVFEYHSSFCHSTNGARSMWTDGRVLQNCMKESGFGIFCLYIFFSLKVCIVAISITYRCAIYR